MILPAFIDNDNQVNQDNNKFMINPFNEFFLDDQLGVLSYSIKSANNTKIGKTELLNSILYTRFDIDSNDLFNCKKIDLDLGEGFNPKRQIAVIDCNYNNNKLLKGLLKMVNVMILNVLFEDFVDCLLYTSPSPRDGLLSRMPSSA